LKPNLDTHTIENVKKDLEHKTIARIRINKNKEWALLSQNIALVQSLHMMPN
jgi:hypothetical protein